MNPLKFAVFVLSLSPAFLAAKDLMTFSTIENSPYATISERVMRIAYARLNIDLSTLDLPATRAIITSNSGTVDGELYRIKNIHSKYKNLIMIPVPIGKLEGVAITWKKDIAITTWDELSGQNVCFRRGVKFAEAGLNTMRAQPVGANKQLFNMLKTKRCDVIIIARITSIPLVSEFIETQQIKLYQSVLQSYPLFHYLHKKNKHLKPKLTRVLNEMQQEGIIQKVRSQFIATQTQ